MTGMTGRSRASPIHFSEDDSEDDALNLDAYLKVGAFQKQKDAGNSRGRIYQENMGLPMVKTGTRGMVVDSGYRQRVTSRDSSTINSKVTAKVEGSTEKLENIDGSYLSTTPSTLKNKRTQRPLKTAQVNPLLLPLSQSTTHEKGAKGSRAVKKGSCGKEEEEQEPAVKLHGSSDTACAPEIQVRKERNSTRTTSRRTTKKEVDYQWPLAISGDEADDDTFDSLVDFIVSDNEGASLYVSHGESEEDTEKTPIQENKPRRRLVRGRTPKSTLKKKDATEYTESAPKGALSRELIDLTLPPSLHLQPTTQLTAKKRAPEKPCHSQGSDELNQSNALLKNSAPRPDSPPTMGGTGFVTPPSSPSKPLLKSPSKEKHRIPESPHRPSIDAFWSQDVINEWNDQYSPKKEQTPFRRRMLMLLSEDEEDEVALDTSPKKGGPSPTKPSAAKVRAAAAEAKKALAKKKKEFDATKAALAENFFKELDDKVTDGEIQKLAKATGGVKIIWSKKLNSTAGRANWKRETIRSKPSPTNTNTTTTTTTTQTSLHHATIELAEKVIDSRDRLINTLAHEYCHLTNFMISNIRTHPHGASFKQWAEKCTAAFADHPVYGGGAIKVTTKHSYVISYKYIWCCEGCGLEYGRHSKSIDPVKVRCGRCKGGLRQIKPTPRRVGPLPLTSAQKKKDVGIDGDEGTGSGVEAVTKDLAGVKLRA